MLEILEMIEAADKEKELGDKDKEIANKDKAEIKEKQPETLKLQK